MRPVIESHAADLTTCSTLKHLLTDVERGFIFRDGQIIISKNISSCNHILIYQLEMVRPKLNLSHYPKYPFAGNKGKFANNLW